MSKSDTPSVASAFEQAKSSLTSEEETEEEIKETPEETEETQTDQLEEQPEETEESEDKADLEKFDPKKLPKELQPFYKNLMKGFTQGRQKDAEKAKQAEDKAKQLEERLAKLEKPLTEETPKFNSPEEYYAWQAQKTATEVVENERLEGFRTQAVNDFEEFDSRFKEGDNYDPVMRHAIGSQLDELLGQWTQDHGTEMGFPYKTHLKELVAQYDKHVQDQVQKYIKKQNELNRKQAQSAKKQNPKASNAASTPGKIGSIRDAIQLAQEKLAN